MKNITELVPQIKIINSDDSEKKQKKEEIAEIVNKLFRQLKAACPAMFHTLNNNDENAVKRQWIIGFIENGINPTMINSGMRIARRQNNPYMPSVGQFIEWCEKGMSEIYGLPTPDELVKNVIRFCECKWSDDFCNYDYGSDANYWLVNDLYRAMQDEYLSRDKLLIKAEKLIARLTKKMMTGYVIQPAKKAIIQTIKVKRAPLSREAQLSKLNEIKQKFGFIHAQGR